MAPDIQLGKVPGSRTQVRLTGLLHSDRELGNNCVLLKIFHFPAESASYQEEKEEKARQFAGGAILLERWRYHWC